MRGETSYESGQKPDVSMHVEGTTGMVCPVDVSERVCPKWDVLQN